MPFLAAPGLGSDDLEPIRDVLAADHHTNAMAAVALTRSARAAGWANAA